MDQTQHNNQQVATAICQNFKQILQENLVLADQIDYSSFSELINAIRQAKAIFLIASGRSGYSMRSAAMRLMHLGLNVYFAGDTTTPAIGRNDLLLAASGSGTTSTVVKAAEKAKHAGARIISMTTNASSLLAGISDIHLLIPAAEKEDHGGTKSKQYAGSLFEQSLLLISDAIFMELWKLDETPAEVLWKRHANME